MDEHPFKVWPWTGCGKVSETVIRGTQGPGRIETIWTTAYFFLGNLLWSISKTWGAMGLASQKDGIFYVKLNQREKLLRN